MTSERNPNIQYFTNSESSPYIDNYNRAGLDLAINSNTKRFQGDRLVIHQGGGSHPYTHSNRPIDCYGGNQASPSLNLKESLQHDDGYGTDSKSNASTSTASPSSTSGSGHSSVNTPDSSFLSPASPPTGGPVAYMSSGSQQYNTQFNAAASTMLANASKQVPAQKQPLIQGNGKIHVNRHAFVMAKKKDASTHEIQDSTVNLEERLRALTTIEEEPNFSSLSSPFSQTYRKEIYNIPPTPTNSNRNLSNNSQTPSDVQEQNDGVSQGFFRAVPVEIGMANQQFSGQRWPGDGKETEPSFSMAENGNYYSGSSDHNSSTASWRDYQRYFEKDCKIPVRNIDGLNRGKFVGMGSENTLDKNINQQLNTNGSSTRVKELRSTTPSHVDEYFGSTSNFTFPGNDSQQLVSRKGSQSVFEKSLRQQNATHSLLSQHPLPFLKQCHCPSQSQPHNPNQHCWRDLPATQLSQQLPTQQHTNADRHLGEQSAPLPGMTNSYNSLPRNFDDDHNTQSFFHDYQRDSNQFTDEDVVLRRSRPSSSASRPNVDNFERYSWQPDSTSQNVIENRMNRPAGAERYSLDLGNIPLLQKQIRATSEMCLQASKRHVFASSADIYKLFQGQKKPSTPPSTSNKTHDFSSSSITPHRHSFHSVPGNSASRASPIQQQRRHPQGPSLPPQSLPPQQSLPSQPHRLQYSDSPLLAASPRQGYLSSAAPFSHAHNSHRPISSPGPLRGDHSIQMPHNSFGNTPMPTSYLQNCMATQVATSSPSSSISTLPISAADLLHVHRQSSDYSSENELQQIEQNAQASRKTKRTSNAHLNPHQEFLPVDSSIDQDSSSSIVDNEPVYVNQPQHLNRNRRNEHWSHTDLRGSSQSSSPPPPPLPPRSRQLASPQNQQPSLEYHQQEFPSIVHTRPDGYIDRSNFHERISTNTHEQNGFSDTTQNDSQTPMDLATPPSVSEPVVFTQKQVINLNQKPIIVNSFVPSEADLNQNYFEGTTPTPANLDLNTMDSKQLQRNSGLPSSQTAYSNPNNFQNVAISKGDESRKRNGSPRTPLSPLEIARVLDTPFATNLISDEDGDKLSTLV